MSINAKVLLTALLAIQQKRNVLDNGHGLCFHIKKELGSYGAYMQVKPCLWDAFRKWPKFSGDVIYPVPCPEEWKTDSAYLWNGHIAFYEGTHSDRMWIGPYGKLRIELLEFMISYLSNAIDRHENSSSS